MIGKTLRQNISSSNVGKANDLKIFFDEPPRYNTVTLGAGSYITGATFEFDGARASHVLAGNYTSISDGVTFLSGLNRDYGRAYTYPFDNIADDEVRSDNCVEVNRYQIVIGHDVQIERGATVLGGVRIGNGAVVSAGSVVSRDVPPYAIVTGNPARIVRYRFPLDVIEKLRRIKWWYWTLERIREQLPLMREPKAFIERFYESESVIPEHPIATQLRQFKDSGRRIYFAPADFSASHSVIEHVLECYMRTYTAADKTILLIGAEAGERESFNRLKVPKNVPGQPTVGLITIDRPSLINVATRAVVIVTTREDISSVCVDYASDHGASIFSGLDENIFAPSAPDGGGVEGREFSLR